MIVGWRPVIRFLNFFLLCLALAENKQHEAHAAAKKDNSGNYQFALADGLSAR